MIESCSKKRMLLGIVCLGGLTLIVLVVESHWTEHNNHLKSVNNSSKAELRCWQTESFEVIEPCHPCTEFEIASKSVEACISTHFKEGIKCHVSGKTQRRLNCKHQQTEFLKGLEMKRVTNNCDECSSENEFFENDDSEDNESLPENEEDEPADHYLVEIAEDIDNVGDDDSNLDNIPTSDNDNFYGKDRTIWKKSPPAVQSLEKDNILHEKPGPVNSTKGLSIRETFRCLFTDSFFNIIVNETNKKAKKSFAKWNSEHPNKAVKLWNDVTFKEMEAFLGIIITSGARHSNADDINELWKIEANPLYRASMTCKRFREILQFIRFDSECTQSEKLATDKVAPISELLLLLNEKLKSLYTPSESLTVDRQLLHYRGRMKFKPNIPTKPARYGIKIWWVCDSKNSYPLSGQIYTGKNATDINLCERVLKDLCCQFKNSGRNITIQSFFTSLSLAKLLRELGLFSVGELRKSEPCIPPDMLRIKNRDPPSPIFGFGDDRVTICSYLPRQKTNTVILSTIRYKSDLTSSQQKPELIDHYNKTRGGVENMDKMIALLTTRRQTKRWPVALFYNILDVACLAAYIIYCENNPRYVKRPESRRAFLLELGKALALPVIEERSLDSQVCKNFGTKVGIECMLGKPVVVINTIGRGSNKRAEFTGACYVCRSKSKYRKTRKECCLCKKPICLEHANSVIKCDSCTF